VQPQRFTAILQPAARGRAYVPVPFDPDQVWAPKAKHHITGRINGLGIRATIEINDQTRGFTLGPAWLRDCLDVHIGDLVEVEIVPEGPQRDDLADDIVAALEANPQAGAFFDSLAQFYRRGYLRWIEATKRRPDERARRIAEMVALLAAGVKDRPQQ
jgi:Bacteriocin-protection, YdeI or OmpD-Associated